MLWGAGLAHVQLSGAGAGGSADIALSQVAAYGRVPLRGNWFVDAQFSLGHQRSHTGRVYQLGSEHYRLGSTDQAWVAATGVSLPLA